MILGNAFTLNGEYRVQSWRRMAPSRLTGRWILRSDEEPSEATVNKQLAAHPWWRGKARVSLRPAVIVERSGAFTEPDILYKRANFKPADDSPHMGTNIVDVLKAAANWRRRIPLMINLVGEEVFLEISDLISDVERVVVDEFIFHEAGHCLGYSTEEKYEDGYFRVGGATRWQLIYVEELRADLLAYGLAAAALSPPRAAAVLLYNLMLRVSADIEAGGDQPRPYGPIPALLVRILRECGWLDFASDGSLRLASLGPAEIADVMAVSGARIIQELVAPEAGFDNPLDSALVAAQWLRLSQRSVKG